MKKIDISELSNSIYKYENYFNVYETEDGLRFFNILRNLSVFPANNSEVEEEYLTKSQDTWYSISYDFYGTLNLWWMICLYNQIINPTVPISRDKTLKILKPEYVGLVLSELQKQIS
jgi:hypothetical protein